MQNVLYFILQLQIFMCKHMCKPPDSDRSTNAKEIRDYLRFSFKYYCVELIIH